MTVKKRQVVAALAGALFLAGGSYAVAEMVSDGPGRVPRTNRFHATLNGYQEVPSVSTTGFGTFDAWLVDRTTLRFRLTYRRVEDAAFMAHIHFAQRSVSGAVSAWLCGAMAADPCPPSGGTVRGTITPADVIGPADRGIEAGAFAELVRAMRAGHTYVNVHTNPRFPGGEIRGQVNDRDQKEFVR